MKDKILVLENGKVFYGKAFGCENAEEIAELVFNTSMVGYQEILSDPSYAGQMVVMSFPLIGNYGLADDDYESAGIFLSGMIVREYNDLPSNFRYTKTLSEAMAEANVPGICQVDTRELVRIIRDEGAMKAMIADADKDVIECIRKIKEYTLPQRPIERVSTKKAWYARTKNPISTVVAIDCGIKYNVIRRFNEFGCNVVVVPYNFTLDDVMKYKPDGLFISNGPGDPSKYDEVINLIKEAKGKLPIFGIGLGHQLIGLAYGAKTYKMKFGHRGANHPVKNLQTGKVEITSQNHSYAIDTKSLEGKEIKLTHINLLDNEAEGMVDEQNGVISLQYHPESAVGPEDSVYLFEKFIELMKKAGGNKNAKENRY